MSKRTKKIAACALVLLIATCGYLALNTFFPKARPISFPAAESVSAGSITAENVSAAIQPETLNVLVQHILRAEPTRRKSVNDAPAAEPCYLVRLQTSGGEFRCYIYEEAAQVYIEVPYEGIYRSEQEVLDLILVHLADQ